MTRVSLLGMSEAVGAVVPVGAAQALVASADNALGLKLAGLRGREREIEDSLTLSHPSQTAACLN